MLNSDGFDCLTIFLGALGFSGGVTRTTKNCRGARCRSLGISTKGSSSSAQARKSWKDWPLVTSSVSRSNQKVTTRYLLWNRKEPADRRKVRKKAHPELQPIMTFLRLTPHLYCGFEACAPRAQKSEACAPL